MVPILALANETLNETIKKPTTENLLSKTALNIQDYHHPLLLTLLAKTLSSTIGQTVNQEDIHDLELSLFDTNPSTVGGGLGEFIFSPRLDNLFSSFAAFESLAQSVEGQNGEDLLKSPVVRTIALWYVIDSQVALSN